MQTSTVLLLLSLTDCPPSDPTGFLEGKGTTHEDLDSCNEILPGINPTALPHGCRMALLRARPRENDMSRKPFGYGSGLGL